MAGLAELDFELDTYEVKLPGSKGQSFTVRGISMADISAIVRKHKGSIEGYYQTFKDSQEAVVSGDPKFARPPETKFLEQIIAEAPDLIADVIAYASDEPKSASKVIKLPFTVQIDAIENILKLTFLEEDGVKKAIETVTRLVSGSTNVLTTLNQAQSISLGSEIK